MRLEVDFMLINSVKHNNYNKTLNDLFLKFFVIISSVFYVLCFYIIFGVDLNTILFSLIHVLTASVLIIKYYKVSKISSKKRKITPTNFLLISAILYYAFSSIKYANKPYYSGFITSNFERFISSIIVFFSIYISLIIWSRINKSYISHENAILNLNKFFKNRMLSILSYGYILFNLYQALFLDLNFYGVVRENTSSGEQFLTLINSVILLFVIGNVVSVINKKNIFSYFKLSLLVFGYFLMSFNSGSRSQFLYPILFILFYLLITNKLKISSLIYLLSISLISFILFSGMVLYFSGRVENDIIFALGRDISYRFDLSDFGYTTAKFNSYIYYEFGHLKDAILYSIPSFTGIDKIEIYNNSTYITMLTRSNLNPSFDYTDSYFSMGSELLGLFGLLLFFPLITFLYEKFSVFFSKYKSVGLLINIATFQTFTRLETQWINYIPTLRNLIIIILLTFIFYKTINIIFIKHTETKKNTLEKRL